MWGKGVALNVVTPFNTSSVTLMPWHLLKRISKLMQPIYSSEHSGRPQDIIVAHFVHPCYFNRVNDTPKEAQNLHQSTLYLSQQVISAERCEVCSSKRA